MINSWQTITSVSSVRKAWKPPSSRPISIYFEFRSKPSLSTIICIDPHSSNKLIAKKYCFIILLDEQIPVSFSWSDFLIFLFSVFHVILLLLMFTKNMLLWLLLFYFIFFFSWKLFLFFHVPGCSGIFRNIPECSVFRVLSTPTLYSPRPSFPTFSLMFIAPLNYKFPT